MIVLSETLEHTCLKPNTQKADIERVCREAIHYGLRGVCVSPYFVREAKRLLEGHNIKTITVVGFPFGYSATPAKVTDAQRAIDEGADEIDALANISAILDGAWGLVKNDIESMVHATHLKGKIVKIIIETGMLQEDYIKRLCDICATAEVDFIKTSTGFFEPGATLEAVQLLHQQLPSAVKIKASGGIASKEAALKFLEAGASRIGASRIAEIMAG